MRYLFVYEGTGDRSRRILLLLRCDYSEGDPEWEPFEDELILNYKRL